MPDNSLDQQVHCQCRWIVIDAESHDVSEYAVASKLGAKVLANVCKTASMQLQKRATASMLGREMLHTFA